MFVLELSLLRRVASKIRYGELGDVYMPRDLRTGEPRGFAFVRFMDQRDADDAIDRLDGEFFAGRELRIQVSFWAQHWCRKGGARLMVGADVTYILAVLRCGCSAWVTSVPIMLQRRGVVCVDVYSDDVRRACNTAEQALRLLLLMQEMKYPRPSLIVLFVNF